MGLDVDVGNFTASSGTGNQSVTGVGFQPKLLILFFIDSTSSGTSVDAKIGRGFYDGSTSVCTSIGFTDGNNNARSRGSSTKCISIVDEAGTLQTEASGVSLDSDGFTINWSTAGGSRVVGYACLGGSDISNVGIVNFTYPTASAYENTSVGFQSDVIIFGGLAEAFGTSIDGSMGWGDALSTSDRHGAGLRDRDGFDASSNSSSGYISTECYVVADDSTTPNVFIDITAIDSNGFHLDKGGSSGWQPEMFAVCLNGTFQVDRGIDSTKTSTGTNATTTAFQPAIVLFDAGGHDSTDAMEQPSRCQFGAMSGSTAEININAASAGVGDHDQNFSTTKAFENHSAGTPTLLSSAEFSSFNSTDFTLNYTTSDGNAYKFGWLAFAAAAAGGATGKSNPLNGPLGGPLAGAIGL